MSFKRSKLAFLVLVLALTVSALTAAPALAAKGGGGGGGKGSGGTTGGSFSLVLLDSTDGLPHWGQRVTFSISTTATTQPNVSVTCSQGGAVVYGAQAGYYAGYPWPNDFILTAPTWTSGAASCTATIVYYDHGKLVSGLSIPFDVAA